MAVSENVVFTVDVGYRTVIISPIVHFLGVPLVTDVPVGMETSAVDKALVRIVADCVCQFMA